MLRRKYEIYNNMSNLSTNSASENNSNSISNISVRDIDMSKFESNNIYNIQVLYLNQA